MFALLGAVRPTDSPEIKGIKTGVTSYLPKVSSSNRQPVLDFNEIVSRRFATWSMGLLAHTEENKQLLLKYATTADFDPYRMSPASLRAFFDELGQNVRWLT